MELPPEIIHLIVFQLRHDQRTLSTLCLVDKFLLAESRSYLYKNVALSPAKISAFLPLGCFVIRRPANQTRFLTTVSQSPSVASHILTFAFYYNRFRPLYPGEDVDVDENTVDAPLSLLNPSIRLMENLEDLTLILLSGSLSSIIEHCTLKLRAFRYIPCVEEWAEETDDLHDFIVATSLTWKVNRTGFYYNALGGRNLELEKITSLGLVGLIEADKSSSRILKYFFDRQQQPEVLHLSGDVDKALLCCSFPEVLRLPNLRIFIQSFRSTKSSQEWNNENESSGYPESRREEVATWFNALPHFQTAYFQRLPTIEARSFIAYNRGTSKSTEVEAAEVWDFSPWF
ncbi:hypothetical protein NP233_g161 [Leucocoprinus birnbaumii]|uniref:Uncharacterized protein n=1 Tax=Leucocoprinus birnbaumii TaxID=56174 RepID=A0AAD5YYS8_9AGAR|nr:hypothetical protein NP233_g161 [Leucocoprinus birnbaumii]